MTYVEKLVVYLSLFHVHREGTPPPSRGDRPPLPKRDPLLNILSFDILVMFEKLIEKDPPLDMAEPPPLLRQPGQGLKFWKRSKASECAPYYPPLTRTNSVFEQKAVFRNFYLTFRLCTPNF